MKALIAIMAVLAASPALAQEECLRFTSELLEPGERVARFDDEGFLYVETKDGTEKYATAGAGTGIPWRAAQPVDGTGEELAYIEHKGDLIIDMEVFVPACD